MKTITFFQRKPRKFNFSLESIFILVREHLANQYNCKYYEAKYFSQGFFKRLLIAFDFYRHQGDVNHITGDINFSNLFLKKSKTILTVLDVGFMTNPSAIQRAVLKFFWITLPLKRSKYITTISNSAKNEILKHTNCNPDKIKVIYVPINAEFKKSIKEFNAVKPTILQVGTKFNKNIDRLIESLKDIPCKLNIVGNLSEIQLKKLKEYQIDFELFSNLSNQEIIQQYIVCDILSFVSTYEGFGMPIVEANKVGRVVITSNLYSMPEVAGEAAVLVDPYKVSEIREAFQKVISDEKYRDMMIEKGYKNAGRFKINFIAKEYAMLYNDIISNNTYK